MPAKPPPSEAELQKLAERILSDPNTVKIAEKLKVPVEEYVQSVMTYYLDPKAEPEFVTISDANLKKIGAPPPPTQEEMAKYLNDLSEQKFGRARSTFEAASPTGKRVALKPEPTETPATQGNDEELQKRVKRGGKV